MTPRWPLTPLLLTSHVRLYPRIIVSKFHDNYTSKYVETVTFFKNFNQRSLTPRWPLTPHLMTPRLPLTPLLFTSHVWLYPRIIVSKSHENMSKYVDTVTFSSKTWTKGHWLLNNLWPQVCWGHMCDSTHGSLCLSPMKIHQSMWIGLQWPSFFKNFNQRSLTPRWPLTPHLLRSQGLLCPSPMGIHQCMWIQWSILQNFSQNYHILRTTYYMLHAT